MDFINGYVGIKVRRRCRDQNAMMPAYYLIKFTMLQIIVSFRHAIDLYEIDYRIKQIQTNEHYSPYPLTDSFMHVICLP